MGIFDAVKEPVFIKETSSAKEQLLKLEALLPSTFGETKRAVERDIRNLRAGIFGEDNIEFELKNSHMPMWVVRDLYLSDGALNAQIDFLVVTRGCTFIIECKNLFGNIEVNNKGSFIRTVTYSGKSEKEGIYSPITQNERHLQLLKKLRREKKKNALTRALFDRYFEEGVRTVVVLANPKTVLNDRYAPKDIKSKIIRADGLVSYIENENKKEKARVGERNEKEAAAYAYEILSLNRENPADYAEKYTLGGESGDVGSAVAPAEEIPRCPKCGSPMVKRVAARGVNAGNEFWGCPAYPKCKGIINI